MDIIDDNNIVDIFSTTTYTDSSTTAMGVNFFVYHDTRHDGWLLLLTPHAYPRHSRSHGGHHTPSCKERIIYTSTWLERVKKVVASSRERVLLVLRRGKISKLTKTS